MRNRVRASGKYLLWACLAVLAVSPAAAWAAGSSSQPAGDAGLYGPAVGRARYVPEGYKAPVQRLQFVIFGDRNGGEQPGFMEQGIALANLLRPEFILSIGDQIPGGVVAGKDLTAEQALQKIREQWVEQDALVARFQVPYFWAIGNHDMWDKPSGQYYTDLHGPRYYSFDAKSVHVIVLNSEEYQEVGGKGLLGDRQIAWLTNDLDKSRDAALTVVAVHQPVWASKTRNDWPAVEAMLAQRNAIVFAGHYHEYTCQMRSGIPHVIVGPVAGEQKEPNEALGRFRHVTLVTVEDGKPYVALVKLGAALPVDAVPWQTQENLDQVLKVSRLDYLPAEVQVDKPVSIVWSLTNPLKVATRIEATWPKDSAWQIEPATASVVLQPKETKQLEFQGRLRLNGAGQPPAMQAAFSWPSTDVRATHMDWPAQPLRTLRVGTAGNIRITGPVEPGWAELPQAALTDVSQCTGGLQYWSGSQDLAVEVKASLDGTQLCILAEVADDDIQPDGDELDINLANTPPDRIVESTSPSFYKLVVVAPDEKGLQSIRWASKGRLEFAAAARRVAGGWALKVSLDIAPLLENVKGELRIPFNFTFKDVDKDHPGPTTFTWSGTRDAVSSTRQWGVLVIPAERVRAAQQAAKEAAQQATKE